MFLKLKVNGTMYSSKNWRILCIKIWDKGQWVPESATGGHLVHHSLLKVGTAGAGCPGG